MKNLLLAAALLLLPLFAAPSFGQKTVQSVYQEGVQAFNAQNYTEALEKFETVLQYSPRDPRARSYVFKCKNLIASGAGQKNNIEGELAKLIIPQIDLTEAPIGDVLTYLASRAEELSGGKLVPNFIYKGTPEQRQNTLITLNMRGVPLDQAIKYVGQLSRSRVTYEQHAIVIDPNLGSSNEAILKQAESAQQSNPNGFSNTPTKDSIFE